MERKLFILTFACIIFSSFSIKAQDEKTESHQLIISIPEVVMLDLESAGSKSIVLNPESPNTAGLAIDFTNSINNDIWINYSSIVGGSKEPTRMVTVALNGPVPGGVLLTVSASGDAGEGDGKVGVPLGEVVLSAESQTIISGIGSCFTGDGINKGHRLSYSLQLKDPDSYAELNYDESTDLTVTYTLTDIN